MFNYHFTITYVDGTEHIVAFVADSVKQAIGIIFDKYDSRGGGIVSVAHDYSVPVVDFSVAANDNEHPHDRHMKGVF